MSQPADNRARLDRLRAAQYDWDEATLLAALEGALQQTRCFGLHFRSVICMAPEHSTTGHWPN